MSDEALAEQEQNANGGEDLRANLVESLGLTDDDDHKDIIDKAVEREQKLRSGYGELLGKKYIPLKKAYQELSSDPRLKEESKKKNSDFDPDEFRQQIKQDLIQEQNESFLDDSGYSDDFKQKVREELGRNPGKSAQSVLNNSEYLKFFKDKEQADKRNGEAANNGSSQGGKQNLDAQDVPEKFNDPKFMATEEGRKEFDDWAKANK